MTNAYRYDFKESILLLLIGLFCPIIAVPLIFISIYKKNLLSIYVFGLLIALLIAFMPPYADSYHYYLIYKSTYTFQLSNWFVSSKDFLFYFLCYVFNSLQVPYITFRLLLIIFEMFVFSYIFSDFIKSQVHTLDSRKILLISIILFLSIDIMLICFMVRYTLMLTFLFLGIYLLSKEKNVLGVVSLFLAFATHFAGFLFLPGIILSILLRFKLNISKKIILSIIFLLLGLSLFSFMYTFLPALFKSETYISGVWSGLDAKSFNGMMYYILQYYVIAGIMIFCFIISSPHNNIISRMAFWGVVIFFCICSFSELSQRVWLVIKLFIILSLLDSIINTSSYRMILTKLYGLAFLLLFAQMMALYGFRDAIFDRSNIMHSINLYSVIFDEAYDDAYFFRRSTLK